MVKKDGRFLLIRRAKNDSAQDYWCPVTGAVEPGESQEQAVIREAKEEVGIDVKPIKKVWECPTENEAYILHWWYVKLINEEIKPNPLEVQDYCWVNYKEMEHLDKTFSADLRFFREFGSDLPDS